MRIVMAGSSGFLGTHLRRRLTQRGHEIVQLVRRQPTGSHERQWRPDRGELDPAIVANVDAVINMAGAALADRRLTASYKAVVRASRLDTTTTISSCLASLPVADRPSVLLNASAIGFYGDTGETAVDEDSPPGEGFFSDVCRAWEAASSRAEEAGVRVVRLRSGFALHPSGGLLKRLLLPFRLGLGGRLGDGRQWMPCLSMADWLSAVEFLLRRSDVAGAVNVVGPEPVRNSDFTKALARELRRPAIAVVPVFALRIVVGEFTDAVVASQRVLPGVLNRAGFEFRDRTIDAAIRAALRQDPTD